jgi:hypothetical protein
MVAVILINQIVGPVTMKFAIKKIGEDGKASNLDSNTIGIRTALIVGIDGYSLALANRLQGNHWKVHSWTNWYSIPPGSNGRC